MIDTAPAKPRLPHAFTKDNAAEMARKATQARLEREARERAEVEHARTIEAQAIANATTPDEAYRLARLARTREQLKDLDEEWENCDNAKDRKALADSIRWLTDVLFALSGWSKPGLTRPRPAKSTKTTSSAGPLDPES